MAEEAKGGIQCDQIKDKLDDKIKQLKSTLFIDKTLVAEPMEYYKFIDAMTDVQQAYEAAVVFGCIAKETNMRYL